MTDIHNKAVRSFNMAQIRSKNTKPEMLVRAFLHKLGYRYRLHVKDLPGKPDIVLPKYKTIIMINGCFWHGHHGCKRFKMPKSREEYWIPKIEKNISKDIEVKIKLENLGWRVITIWECQLKGKTMENTLSTLNSSFKVFKLADIQLSC